MKKIRIWDYSKENPITDKIFIKHIEQTTAVEVPKNVFNTLRKIQKHHDLVDGIAMAINYRRLQNMLYSFKEFGTSKNSAYIGNYELDKFLSTTLNNRGVLSNKEVSKLIQFLNYCPPGYDLTRFIGPHIELQPVIT